VSGEKYDACKEERLGERTPGYEIIEQEVKST
jgi:hypothetical protein